jgi:hypothetical protein
MFRSFQTTITRWLTPAFLIMSVLCSAIGSAADQAPPSSDQPMSFWMQRKLEYSKNILAGIAAGDFDKIVTSAESMRKLSTVEGFIRGQTPGYRTQLQIFEASADEIIRQGKNDNAEGAALAFTQLTISCVNCHKQLREAK